ncbi:MAG: VanW family protein [Proteobacteria bacterium]|nr:VanW family protein [Pseudomonadota bacterium]
MMFHRFQKILQCVQAPVRRYRARPWWPLARDAALLVLLVLLGALSAFILLDPRSRDAQPVTDIRVGGVAADGDGDTSAALMHEARRLMQQSVTLKSGDFAHRTTWGALGAEVDMRSLSELLGELRTVNSSAARYNRRRARPRGVVDIPMPIGLRSDAAVEALVVLKEMLDVKSTNARFNFQDGKIDAEVPGRSLDVYESLRRLDAALRAGQSEVEIALVPLVPEVTLAALSGIRADAVAGFYETPHSRMKKDADRTHNLILAASKLDGEIILPGEVLSYNGVVGDRTEARGFRYAPVIAGGAIVEGMGGGACQIASTLYAASFFTGLIIEERKTHSRPSSYIKLGLDATVDYPALDLKIRNPFAYPVVLHFVVADGVVRAEIRAPERPYTVTMLRKVVGTSPFPVRVIPNADLPKGTEVITQLGVPGYVVQQYKIIERDKVGYRFSHIDKYPPTVQFVHRGTGDPVELRKQTDKSKWPKADTHRPYRASAGLRMVQGPGIWYENVTD